MRSGVPANLGLRVIAALYDLLPVLGLWFIATVLALGVTGGALDVRLPVHRILVQMLLLMATAAYFVASWLRGGQTIGMKPWRLRVVRADGSALDVKRALVRFAVAVVSLAPAGLGFWWALIDARKRTWHDIAAGTLMVQMEEEPRRAEG
jgi:uncharacterized RDD family membrane protein YckC